MALIGNQHGQVEVVFAAASLEAFVAMLNEANVHVGEDYLLFSIDEYTPGRAQLMVSVSGEPHEITGTVNIDPMVTSIEEVEVESDS